VLILWQHVYLYGGFQSVPCVFILIKQRVFFGFHAIQEGFSRWIKARTTSFLFGTFADMTRGKSELLAENALLRQQLVILRAKSNDRPTGKGIGFS
jgi:putative transposase